MLDSVKRSVQAIKNLGIANSSWDCILVYIVSQIMPKETCSLWEQSLFSNKYPTFMALTEFLECRFRALEFLPESNKTQSKFVKKLQNLQANAPSPFIPILLTINRQNAKCVVFHLIR